MKLNRNILLALLTALVMVFGCSKPLGQTELDKGLRELKRGNYVRARVLLEKSISVRPGHIDNAMAHNYLGITAWRLGQLEDAMTAFEDSRRLNPNLIEPVYNLGVLAGEREDLRSAARYLNEAATLNQDDSRPLEYLAELYMERKQWSHARNALYSALDRNPRSARIQNSIAVVHMAMGQEDDAIESLMYALEADTKYAPALFNLAVLYDVHKGDADQARAYYKRYISAAKKDEHIEAAKEALARIQAQGTLAEPDQDDTATEDDAPDKDRMLVLDEQERPGESVEPAVTESPYDTYLREAKEKAQSGYIEQALDLCQQAADFAGQQRRYDLQERALREAVGMAIDQPRAHAMLGQNLFERGKISQAARAFRQAITLNANYAPAQLGMARITARSDEIDAAVVHYKKAVSSDPSLADAQWELALVYDQNLDVPELAAAAYRSFAENVPGDARRAAAVARAEELAPAPKTDVEPRREAGPLPVDQSSVRKIEYKKPDVQNKAAAIRAFNRASIHQEKREWDRATYYYLKSLENDDQLASVFYNLGICYTMTRENELARDAYVRALKLNPDMIDAQYNLALLYNEAGNERAAAKLLDDLVKKRPSYASAHYALGVIYSKKPDQYDRAKQHYSKYLKFSPRDPSAPVIREWIDSH